LSKNSELPIKPSQIFKSKERKITTPKDILEKIEQENLKREEKEKLKLLEKLESQIIKKKKVANPIIKNNDFINNNNTNTNYHKRLIDTISSTKNNKNLLLTETGKFDKKILDDSEFRKTIHKEKIEIDCNKPIILKPIQNITKINNENDMLEEEKYLIQASKEKMKFFVFKVPELYEFLSSIKLVRYIEMLIEDGFEDLESILGK
jgi:hypothetical protein